MSKIVKWFIEEIGALIRGIKVIDGNKAFTTEDPFSRRLILREAKVKTDELRVSTPAQQIEINANNPNHGINIPSQQNVTLTIPQPRNQDRNNRTATRHSRRLQGLEPD